MRNACEMTTAREKISYLLYWIIIFIVSASMIIYGIGKPLQFESLQTAVNNDLSEGHQLMWRFYGYTKAYPLIIGFFEVTGGIFILFNRTRLLGCFLLTVLLSNIIIQDYLYEIVALNSALFYQILIFILLAFDHAKLKIIIKDLFISEKKNKSFLLMITALVLAIAIKYFETKILQ